MCNACKRADLRERPVIIVNNNYIDNCANMRGRRFGRLPFLPNEQWYGDGYGYGCSCGNPYSYQGCGNRMLLNILNQLQYLVALLRNFGRARQSQCQCDPRKKIEVIPHKKPCAGAKAPCAAAKTPCAARAEQPVCRDKQIADLETKLKNCNLKPEEKEALDKQIKELKIQKKAEEIINNASPSNPIKDLKPEDASAYNIDDPTSTASIWAQNDETQKADNKEAARNARIAELEAKLQEGNMDADDMNAAYKELTDLLAEKNANSTTSQTANTGTTIDDRIAELEEKLPTGEMSPEEYEELNNLYAQRNTNSTDSQTTQTADTNTTTTSNDSTAQVTYNHDWVAEKDAAMDELMSATPSTAKIPEVTQSVADSAQKVLDGDTRIDKKEWDC